MNEHTTKIEQQEKKGWINLEQLKAESAVPSDQLDSGSGDASGASSSSDKGENVPAPDTVDQTGATPSIKVTTLAEWLPRSISRLDDIQLLVPSVENVDFKNNLLVGVSTPMRDAQAFLIRDAHKFPALDLEPVSMRVFDRGYSVVYQYGEEIFLETYAGNRVLVVYQCMKRDDFLIPYSRTKITLKDKALPVVDPPGSDCLDKLKKSVDLEALQLLYPPALRDQKEIKTVQDAITWLFEKKMFVHDVGHLVKLSDAAMALVR